MTSRGGPTHADRLLYLLVLRCQAGDEAAFGQLLTSFGSRTLAHLRALVGDEADDVQQVSMPEPRRRRIAKAAINRPGRGRRPSSDRRLLVR